MRRLRTNQTLFLAIGLATSGLLLASCQKIFFPTESGHYQVPEIDFDHRTQAATVETGWYEEWTSLHGETLPEPLEPLEQWQNPHVQQGFPAGMHEDSFNSDVSQFNGPVPEGADVQYFHVLEKRRYLSGMCPFFAFVDENTLATISFGRDAATLVLLDVSGPPVVLDSLPLPGRLSRLRDLLGDEGRMAVFSDTSGGAYSFLSNDQVMYVPGAHNEVIRIPIRNRRIDRENAQLLELDRLVAMGSIGDHVLDEEFRGTSDENKLTALLPDSEGRVWFTTRFGVVGVIDPSDRNPEGLPRVHATNISFLATREKAIEDAHLTPEQIDEFLRGHDLATASVDEIQEIRADFRQLADLDPMIREEIQNSFAAGQDGAMYILSNMALHKVRFDPERRRIVLDSDWAPTYAQGDLVYDNEFELKPGQLNRGSGTSPTLIGDEFITITDNANGHVNIVVFRQSDGTQVFKHRLFGDTVGAAVENSIIGYGRSLVVANAYGYSDPFGVNDTAGGMMRFDYDDEQGTFVPVEGWPETGHFDAKSATPKLSSSRGLIYVYNRQDEATDEHFDWQLTALDFRTGLRVFWIKGYFDDDNPFDDSVGFLVRRNSLGNRHYDREVMSNLWGTFSFGPNNSIYMGAYRGFLRFQSPN